MLKEYDLWLDESGSFIDEKETVEKGLNPSLIGGWLVPHDKYRESDLDDMIVHSASEESFHSTGLTKAQKNEKVIPALVKMHDELGGRLFFIENKEVRQYSGNRELYLSMMAYGLLHLLQDLNAKYETVHLYVTIARRIDKTVDEDHQKIESDEYLRRLNTCIRIEKAAGHIILDEDTQMEFHIDSGRQNNKLKMADYACNAELTIDADTFTDASRASFKAISEDALRFSFMENYEENRIKQYLTRDDISDALFMVVSSRKRGLLKKMLPLVLNRIEKFGYRGMKVQLEQCAKEFTTDAYMEDDFKEGERILGNLLNVVIPEMEEKKFPCEKLEFTAELQLTDMYLREGDLNAALEEIKKCEKAQKKLPNSLENILSYYQLIEKKALCFIDTFEFSKAYTQMDKAAKVFEELMQAVTLSDTIGKRYPNLISEYYGDALCMKIYAGMLAQRSKPSLYDDLVKDSDTALLQYGPHEGELERHRQYRAFVEAQHGNIYEACVWLFMTQLPDVTEKWLKDRHEITVELCRSFLDAINSGEVQASRRYYIMYYVRIMAEAYACKDPLASALLNALTGMKMNIEPVVMHDHTHVNVRGNRSDALVVDDLRLIVEPDTKREYHPNEAIYWRTAYSLYQAGEKELSDVMYEKAVSICFSYDEYLQLMVTGLGIQTERLALLYHDNDEEMRKKASTIRTILLREIKDVIKAEKNGSFKFIDAYLAEIEEEVQKGVEPDWKKLWKTSRKITL